MKKITDGKPIYCTKESHFSKNKYYPYHRLIQRKMHFYDMDEYVYENADNYYEEISVGINKKIIWIDFAEYYDSYKKNRRF